MTDKLALEKAIDFIETLTRDPLLVSDDIEMTLADVQRHARIELASIRKVLDASPQEQMVAYRLITEGEIVQRGDQPLNDDCVSWGELVGWEIGIAYYHSVFVPIRRAIITEGSDNG